MKCLWIETKQCFFNGKAWNHGRTINLKIWPLEVMETFLIKCCRNTAESGLYDRTIFYKQVIIEHETILHCFSVKHKHQHNQQIFWPIRPPEGTHFRSRLNLFGILCHGKTVAIKNKIIQFSSIDWPVTQWKAIHSLSQRIK